MKLVGSTSDARVKKRNYFPNSTLYNEVGWINVWLATLVWNYFPNNLILSMERRMLIVKEEFKFEWFNKWILFLYEFKLNYIETYNFQRRFYKWEDRFKNSNVEMRILKKIKQSESRVKLISKWQSFQTFGRNK